MSNDKIPQIFDPSFEGTWRAFDESFRARFLKSIQQMGSLHRLTGDEEEINTEYGRRFYEAFEETLNSGEFISKWKKSLVDPIPKNLDEMAHVFKSHSVYPQHAFYLLMLFIHEYPLRAFFSGRDVSLPFNTLTLKFVQLLSDPLPTGVDWELELIRFDRCPGWAHGSYGETVSELASIALPLDNQGHHPQHHRWDLVWVWHFDWPLHASSTF